MIRHGDLLLRPIPAPEPYKLSTVKVNDVAVTLLEGEKTGHSHTLHGADLTLFRTYTGSVVAVPTGAELRHQEHATLLVPPGWYEVVRQRVYTPTGPRTVRD